jgi:hypothetical protein
LVQKVTEFHHKRAAAAPSPDAEAVLKAIETFLAVCRRPAVLEYGEDPILLVKGCYALEIRSGRLAIEIWDEARNLSRRIVGLESVSTGVLDCSIQKFGGKPGRLSFLDLDRPQTAHRTTRGAKQTFAEQFRRMLLRQFPGWEVAALTSAQDLRRSFSSLFPRARLTLGNQQIAALACRVVPEEPDLLAAALLWFDHVKTSARAQIQTTLCLFLPEEGGALTAHRLRWLTGGALSGEAKVRLFRFNAHGSAGEVDAKDLGNLHTRVNTMYAAPGLTPELRALLKKLETIPGIGWCPEVRGGISVRSRGLEFARIENGRVLLGIETKQEINACHTEDVTNFAAQLSRLSAAPVSAPGSAGFPAPPQYPERWFESAVRANLPAIAPDLALEPVHAQVITFAANDRDSIDLLACSPGGHLAVLELKTTEDIQLPMQALDYWMRVAWHAEREELKPLFPDIALKRATPRLLLIAPAFVFHSSTATLLRYFSAEIDVERVGVNTDWQNGLRVVLRLRGAEVPVSHRSSE